MDATLVARGADLAAIGNCAACHTREDGKPFAGGRPMKTPFGTIYSTNITPDTETGIGKWSSDDFLRAIRTSIVKAAISSRLFRTIISRASPTTTSKRSTPSS